MITLIRPNKELKNKALVFKQEFFENKEHTINGREGSLSDMLPVERNIYMIFWK